MSVPVLQSTTEQAATVTTQLLGLAVLAGTIAAVVAVVFRWVSREEVPTALALLAGLSGVALYLNTTTALGQAISGDTSADPRLALFHIVAFLAGGLGAIAGRRAGDQFGTDVLFGTGPGDIDEDVNRLVRTVGRVVVVTLPDEIDDVVGYDPVPETTKEKLAGKRFVFPRNLTVGELQERLISRLKSDYGVGTVDIELAGDGSVEYLALGSRTAGIGPTLPPATNAVAIRADPAYAASAGDLVQVWETEPMRRVLTGELRGTAGDVVTVAIDAADTPKVDPRQQYQLVTLPVEDRPEREFASLLRAADETFSTVTVEAGSPLHGLPVGALDLSIFAIKPDEDTQEPVALPARDRRLEPGDMVFAIGRPEALRRLETAGEPLDPALLERISTPSPGETAEPTPQPGGPSEPTPQPGGPSEPTAAETGEPAPAETTETVSVGEPVMTEETAAPSEPSTPAQSQDTSTAQADSGPGTDTTGTAGGDAGTFDELKSEFESGEADWDEEGSDSEPVEAAADESDLDDAGSGSSFDELKAEFESGEADWEEEDSDSEPIEAEATTGGGDSEAVSDDGGGSSFEELKSEFESGEADWDEEIETASGGDDATASADEQGTPGAAFDDDGESGADSSDDLVGLDEANISFEESDDDDSEFDSFEEDDELETIDLDDEESLELEDEDDLAFEESDEEFEFDDGGDDLMDLDTDDGEDGLDLEETEDEGESDGSDDGDDDGGGGSTFAQLKEEFESGEADWEDEISDSPGGDMRLDE